MSSDVGDRTSSPPVDVFVADAVVGADLAAVDWSGTPLGPPNTWSLSLRTAVNILLSSRFPMWMAWGPELTFFCNAAYRRDTLGAKYPWALGRPSREVWAEVWDVAGSRIETVLSTATATWDDSLRLILERSGYPEETYHTFSYSPLRDDDGAVVGMLCVVSEDTQRVIGERRMATLRDLGSDPSVVRTEEGAIDFVGRQLCGNRRDLPFTLTYLVDESGSARLAGATGIAVGHPAAPPTLTSGSVWPTAVVEREESVLHELRGPVFADLPTGDWDEPPTHALVVPLLHRGGLPRGFLVAALNRYRPLDEGYRAFVELVAGYVAAAISAARSFREQQQRGDALAELDRAKTTFFSNISHEFRTPLALILGPVDELRSRAVDMDERTRAELDAIHRNGLRLSKLVNTLLDFSRIEAGRLEARYEPVDLAAVTADLASVFRSAVEKAGLSFDVVCPPLSRPVYVDEGMWEKVVLNLLSNALKFTFDGSVSVRIAEEDAAAVVTVTDTGTGVPAAEMPRLFERFHRIANARARSHEGSGIGLALVRELVELHGGTITAHSVEGDGTSFAIRLPFGSAHLPTDMVAPAPDATTAVPPDAEPYVQEALRWLSHDDTAGTDTIGPDGICARMPARVLIADDNADMRDYLTRLLTGAGHRVEAVPDGVAALAAARASAFDIVVSDVMMPGLDGLSLVAALRDDTRTASIPVLLLSARAGQDAAIEGLGAGADDYLVKPFAAAELLARVSANVELARTRTHHVRWRTALIDSLQEAFFVCDENGSVIEINTAFTEILGYGTDELPYPPHHPCWPDPSDDPEAYAQVADVLAGIVDQRQGSHTIPVNHRDGRRVWISVHFSPAQDPDTGRRVTVGTFRDVTAEHYAVQRDSALASLNARLSEAGNLSDALDGALAELRDLWHADQVTAALFAHDEDPAVTATVPRTTWTRLSDDHRRLLTTLSRHTTLSTLADVSGGGVLLDHPHGPLALWIDTGTQRPFSRDDLLLLSLLAGHLAQGLARVHQIDQQRETAITLQRAILGPSFLPEGIAVRYEPATRRLEVGGDWYDTVPLPGDRIAVVVGDCVGHGLEAASVMGQLRSACRALLLQDPSPARVLASLDHFAATVPGAICTTVFCGVLHPETGRLVYASAGHPPVILAAPDGTTRLLEEGRSLPLGVRPGRARPESEDRIPARATLLLYTDGLVERRGRPLDEGIAHAAETVQAGRAHALDTVAADLMCRLAPSGGYDDDVALLLYRYPASLHLTFPGEAGQLAPVRAALRAWLGRCDLTPEITQDVLVAVGEVCANAVEHGHLHNPHDPVRLQADAFADSLYIRVEDSGRWKTPDRAANPHRGRGIALMHAMMDDVHTATGPAGTTVEMRKRIC